MEGLAADLSGWEAAGLYDPRAPGAPARLALLRHLATGGVTLDEMRAANASGALVTALSDKLLRGERPLSAGDVATASGIPLDRVLRIWLAAGLPIEDPAAKTLPPDAVEITSLFSEGAKMFGEDGILAFSRVMAAAASQVADAAVALFLGEVQPRLEAATELAWAEANESSVASLEHALTVIVRLVREHMTRSIQRSRAARGPDASEPRQLELAVCFVDLVGSTEWALHLPLATASNALNRFETAAWEAAVQRGGRVVKLIGDEAMMVAPTAASACAIALEVVAMVEEDPDLPYARGAVGFGPVLFRAGDYFGPVVNVVARGVKEGVPGQVLVTSTVRDLVAGDPRFTMGALEPHLLRGIDEPVALAPLK